MKSTHILSSVLYSVAAVGAVIFALSVNAKTTESDTDTNAVKKIQVGLSAGEQVTDFLQGQNFTEGVNKIVAQASKFLGAVGPIVDIFLGRFPEAKSEEMKLLKERFNKINNKLNNIRHEFKNDNKRIDWRTLQAKYSKEEHNIQVLYRISTFKHEFKDVKKLIEWQSAKSIYSKEVQNIKVLNLLWTELSQEKDTNMLNLRVRRFKEVFLKICKGSSLILYSAFYTKSDGVLLENLITAAEKFTDRDRKAVRYFMLSLTRMILQDIKLEIAYYYMMGQRDYANGIKTLWDNRLEKCASVMRDVDNKLKKAWRPQLKSDVEEFGAYNSQLGNKDFSEKLYNFLVKKYYWRNWFVIVYKPVWGYENHDLFSLGGYERYRLQGLNVVVASSEKNSNFNKDAAKSVLDNMNARKFTTFNAKSMLEVLKTDMKNTNSTYAFGGIICDKCDVWYRSEKSRTFFRKLGVWRNLLPGWQFRSGYMRGYLFG